jgi:hypothetical protein
MRLTRQVCARVIAAAIPLWPAVLWSATKMNIEFHPLPFADPRSVDAVQLVKGTGAPLLVGSNGNLLLIPESQGSPQEPAMQLGALPGMTWDAHRDGHGALSVVYTEPGSAACWVMSKKFGAQNETRLHSETFVVYLQPHFVKGPVEGLPVTAILNEEGVEHMMLFPLSDKTNTPRAAGAPGKSIMDARLLGDSTGYWLFTLSRATGESASAGPRTTPSGSRMPGLLTVMRLNHDMQAAAKEIHILGAQPIYEFDVDAAAGDHVAILATTPGGAIYAMAAIKDLPLPADVWKETKWPAPLSSPSLLVTGGISHCAVVEHLGTGHARVLRGSIR